MREGALKVKDKRFFYFRLLGEMHVEALDIMFSPPYQGTSPDILLSYHHPSTTNATK